MDHVPRPLYAGGLEIEVPLMDIIPYQFGVGAFYTFPLRHGFTKDGVLDLDRPVTQVARLLQSWLYFGLMAEYAREPINVGTFIRTNSSPCVIDSRAWNNIAQKRSSSLDCLSLEIQDAINSTFTTFATFALDQLDFVDRHPKGGSTPIPNITLSIRVLVSSVMLYHTRDASATKESHPFPLDSGRLRPMESISSTICSSPAGRLLAQKMRQAGWCPSRLTHIFRSYDYAVVYHLLLLSRQSAGEIDHWLCTVSDCLAKKVHMDEYHVRHTADECCCPMVEAPVSKVEGIIKNGGIPLIEIKQSSDGRLDLQIVQATATTSFVAISHVWADGLGNPEANNLPTCQLERIRLYLSDLPKLHDIGHRMFFMIPPLLATFIHYLRGQRPSGLFWIDTLCIPVSNPVLRQRAINQMAAIYASAKSVLVLDSEIEGLQISPGKEHELISSLPGCAWAGRCWTLQEGAFTTGSIYFRCADRAICPFEIRRSGSRGHLSRMRLDETSTHASKTSSECILRSSLLSNILGQFTKDIKVLNDYNRPKQTERPADKGDFIVIWNALSSRSTSQKEDTYAMLASLLRFNTHYIARLPSPAARMKAIISTLKKVPLSLLYNQGPRDRSNELHYDRWVPTLPLGSFLTSTPLLNMAREGLTLLYEPLISETGPFLIRIDSPIPKQCGSFLLDVDSKRYLVQLRRDPDDKLDPTCYSGCYIVLEKDYRPKYPSPTRGASLLVESTMDPVTTGECLNESLFKSRKSHSHVHIQTIYDCPLEIKADELNLPEDKDGLPVIPGISVLDETRIIIKQGMEMENVAYVNRADYLEPTPKYDHPLLRFSLEILSTRLLLLPTLPLCIAFIIAASCVLAVSAATTNRQRRTTLGISSLVLCMLGPIGVFPVGLVLFLVDRIQQGVGFTALEVTFLVLIFAFLIYCIGILIFYEVWFVFTYYHWLASFQEGFQPGKGYQTLMRLIAWNKALTTWTNSVEDRFDDHLWVPIEDYILRHVGGTRGRYHAKRRAMMKSNATLK